jgi:hypothetical protein
MSSNNSQRADWADELRIAVLTGAYDLIGTLSHNPVQIIFDNQSTVDIEISVNGTSTAKTFPAGEALVLDMRGNHGIASNFTFPLGTKFYAKGSAGANAFSISYTYAVPE